ncbi:unnamed protein product [Kluyveromyces dobzhanskii CBS 2104]|uniref:WGS project CCBQ000000000 data, contig 00043 n=1 Tax=Kluyveromyces dobzhanskii CBS 2104 TaxID=1427455 RepID=A0A0A8L526_9SACH|nr:unnamed protein product [Kluyveromyces dobzhanskii CBS 2104]
MPAYRPRAAMRRLFLVVLVVVVFNVTIFFHEPTKNYIVDTYYGALETTRPESHAISGSGSAADRTAVSDKFFETLFTQLQDAAPMKREFGWGDIKSKDCDMGDVGFDTNDRDERLSYENLASCLQLPENNYASLKEGHEKFLKYLSTVDTSTSTLQNIYPNKKGIVTVGGGKYSLLSYLMINMVRRSGSTLPIEVIIPPSDEPETVFCDDIQQFNARCVYFKDRLGPELVENFSVKSYQVKGYALLLTSFEEFVFIDSDNMPLKNLDEAFEYSVFKDHGMVVWPDIWRRMTSPQFYQLAGIPIDFTKRMRNVGDEVSPVSRYDKLTNTASENKAKVPMHDFLGALPDPTTESGQMIVDKKSHLKTLLLALYYNVYGPEYYYQLFSQGTSGQGDKETFVQAAHILDEPFYQVKKTFGFAAYWDPREGRNSAFQGAGLLQHDPEQDYKLWNILKTEIEGQMEKYSIFDKDYQTKRTFYQGMLEENIGDKGREHLFLHASFHKYDPWNLYNEQNLLHSDGKHFRAYPCSSGVFKGFDVELYLWDIVNKVICSEHPVKMTYQEKLVNELEKYAEVCKYTKDRLSHLNETHDEFVAYASATGDERKCVDIKRGH